MINITLIGEPIGKPRMTQRDKWARRPVVLAYRAWADKARLELYRAAKVHHLAPGLYEISWTAYIGMAPSWSKKKKARLAGKDHFGKPDRDNIDKALLDALLENDAGVCCGIIRKRWDDGQGPRLEVHITEIEGEMP
jgi:Holliday junction resolvase RusA-like endonuclease